VIDPRERHRVTRAFGELLAYREQSRRRWKAEKAARGELSETQVHTLDRQVKKRWLITMLGGCCQRCQWSPTRPLEEVALEFHHRDATAKSFTMATNMFRSLTELIAEAKKCDLLCARCHRIVEAERDEAGLSGRRAQSS
jgi:hypothetical protein